MKQIIKDLLHESFDSGRTFKQGIDGQYKATSEPVGKVHVGTYGTGYTPAETDDDTKPTKTSNGRGRPKGALGSVTKIKQGMSGGKALQDLLFGKIAAKLPVGTKRLIKFKESLDEGTRLLKTYGDINGPRSAKVYKDSEWDDHIVKYYRNGVYQTAADSHHYDDKEDAHDTAKHFAGESIDEENLDEAYSFKKMTVVGDKPQEHGLTHVWGHTKRLDDLGVDYPQKHDGEYGPLSVIQVKNNKTGETSNHSVYQSGYDRESGTPLMSVRSAGKPGKVSAEHSLALQNHLKGTMKQNESLDEMAGPRGMRHAQEHMNREVEAGKTHNQAIDSYRRKFNKNIRLRSDNTVAAVSESKEQVKEKPTFVSRQNKPLTMCNWFAKRRSDATTTVEHPILGDVPTCAKCATFANSK